MDVPYQTAIISQPSNPYPNTHSKVKTISGYKKTEVLSAFEKAIKNGRAEEACTWMTELNASGMDLWRTFYKIAFTDINIANPYLPLFLKRSHKTYITILSKLKKDKQIEIRNNQKMRNLLADITVTLTMSNHTTNLQLNFIIL